MKILLTLLLLMAATLPAQNKWKIETSNSNINFAVSHLVVSEVTGRFREFSGIVESVWDDFSDMKITVNIQANSIDTNEPQRDAHLKSPDFFDADKYNNITFKSNYVEKTGDMKYKVTGDLTMHGVTKSAVLDVIFKGKTKSPSGQMVAIFKASTTIDRTQWGLKWNRTLETGGLLVGNDVNLVFNIELVQG